MKARTFLIGLIVCVVVLASSVNVFATQAPSDESVTEVSTENVTESVTESATNGAALNEFDKIFGDYTNDINAGKTANKIVANILLSVYGVYSVIKRLSPAIAAISIVTGIIMIVVARRNKPVQRRGLYLFIIGIPLILGIIIFGVGILNGIYIG